jgi:hypothetical protein
MGGVSTGRERRGEVQPGAGDGGGKGEAIKLIVMCKRENEDEE